MLKIIGLSDMDFETITTHYFNLFAIVDSNSNTIQTGHVYFELTYYDDHIAIEFPNHDCTVTIMKCDFWRIEIE